MAVVRTDREVITLRIETQGPPEKGKLIPPRELHHIIATDKSDPAAGRTHEVTLPGGRKVYLTDEDHGVYQGTRARLSTTVRVFEDTTRVRSEAQRLGLTGPLRAGKLTGAYPAKAQFPVTLDVHLEAGSEHAYFPAMMPQDQAAAAREWEQARANPLPAGQVARTKLIKVPTGPDTAFYVRMQPDTFDNFQAARQTPLSQVAVITGWEVAK